MIGDILQPTHLLFILVVALLVLGPKRLPEVGRALGRGLRDFRSALNTDELRDQMNMMSTTSTYAPTPTNQQSDNYVQPSFATEPESSDPWPPQPGFSDPPTSAAATELHATPEAATELHATPEPATEVHATPEPAAEVHATPEPAAEQGTSEPATAEQASPESATAEQASPEPPATAPAAERTP